MFKWIKKLIIKQVKGFLNEEKLNKMVDELNAKLDLSKGMTEEEERIHFLNAKKLAKELIFAYLDVWAKK